MLLERASAIRYTYIACLVKKKHRLIVVSDIYLNSTHRTRCYVSIAVMVT
jgi:hypothetical protein